ncbi:helix-turn-helix domain-containing protein [Nocardioides sp. 1609]|uniref:PucR family transcriptional regulator n=1 Tax=Nocardioides sp. 1609 TaxID=2508327 RepID=UPI00106F0CC8|nr:helix-turn-helix domain-containing protein [Nocardioides sp. 1609]
MVSETDATRSARLAHAWSQLVDGSDAIADSITLTLFERDVELYERIGPELRADVRASCRQHIRRGLEILSGQSASGSAKELWRETGRRRARQGVPLELVLNAYTLGARVLWEALITHGSRAEGAAVDEGMLLSAARTVWANLDVQSALLIDAYRRESRRLHRQDLQRQHAALDALLEGRGADPAYVEEARAALDVGPDDGLACVTVLPGGQDHGADLDHTDRLGAVEDRLDRAGLRTHWHVRDGISFGLVCGDLPDEAGLVELLSPRAPARIGVALSGDGLAGFATAYLLATRAAQTLDRHDRRAVAVTDRLPEVLLVGSPQVGQLLVDQALGGLLAQPESQRDSLLLTLAALLRHDGSPTHAAADLFCHRNTVIYRLKQIEALTGRSLGDPRDKMLLGLALAAHGHEE